MKYYYYPGCTLHTKSKNFDTSGRNCAKALGIELTELPDWTCCGTVFPMAVDNMMNLVSPVRNLAKAKEGKQDMVVLCAFCYNVFKRTNRVLSTDPDARQKINDFLREDVTEPYQGEVRSLHLLEVLRDELGFEKLETMTKKKLGIKVAPYYGCMLLRPGKEMELDDPEQPTILHDLLTAIGAETIDFPYKTECCSSYLTVNELDTTVRLAHSILESAVKNGAEAITVS